MAQIHISKDPSNPSTIPFAYDPHKIKTSSEYSHDKTEKIFLTDKVIFFHRDLNKVFRV